MAALRDNTRAASLISNSDCWQDLCHIQMLTSAYVCEKYCDSSLINEVCCICGFVKSINGFTGSASCDKQVVPVRQPRNTKAVVE